MAGDMYTRKVFWEGPYRTQLDTTVTNVTADEVTLASTIFFAFSGGQESDRGTIGGHAVLDARKADHEIVYTLPANHGLMAGQTVSVDIDWARRYRLMRLHFAAELVLELVYRQFPGIVKVGAHIAEDKARLDFALDESITPALPALAHAANALIADDHEILTGFDDPVAERRYWQVAGFARVACGGTHVRRTGEIGHLALKRRNVGRGKERIEIYLDSERGATPAS